MLVFEEKGKAEYPEKPLGAKERTNNKLNPHMASTPGFEPGSLWWEVSALTTAPPLLLTDTKQMADFVTTKSRQDGKCRGGGGWARLELTEHYS